MDAKEQYQQFNDWLIAKYRECCVEWHHAANQEVRDRYNELLKRIGLELNWAKTNGERRGIVWPTI